MSMRPGRRSGRCFRPSCNRGPARHQRGCQRSDDHPRERNSSSARCLRKLVRSSPDLHQIKQGFRRRVGEGRVVDVLVPRDDPDAGDPARPSRIASNRAASASGSWNGCPGRRGPRRPAGGAGRPPARPPGGASRHRAGRSARFSSGVVRIRVTDGLWAWKRRPANRSGTVALGPKLTMSRAPTLTTCGSPGGRPPRRRSGPAERMPPTSSSASSVVVRSSRRRPGRRGSGPPSPARRRPWRGRPGPRTRRFEPRPGPVDAGGRHAEHRRRDDRPVAPSGRSGGRAPGPSRPSRRRRWPGRSCVSRFRPARSATGWNMAMSLPPTNGRVWPLARVLTITLGRPNGRARIAAVPMIVPADPPRPKTPSTPPFASRSSDRSARPLGRQGDGLAPVGGSLDRSRPRGGRPRRGRCRARTSAGRASRRRSPASRALGREAVADEGELGALGVERPDQHDRHVRPPPPRAGRDTPRAP